MNEELLTNIKNLSKQEKIELRAILNADIVGKSSIGRSNPQNT